eukprot:2050686-Prymnesium_polylepis.1
MPCTHTYTTSGSMKSREERTRQARENRAKNKRLAAEVKERGGFICVAKLVEKAISKVKSRAKDRRRASSWQKNNKEKVNEKNRAWAHSHPDTVSNKQKVYKHNNRDVLNAKEKEKYNSDEAFRIKQCMRSRLRQFFKHTGFTKPSSTRNMIGCSYEFLKEHLEWQLQDGITLDSCQIDHIFPLAKYKDSEIWKANHWSNLQPMKAFDNNSKHCKFPSIDDANKVQKKYWPESAEGYYD